MIQFKKFMIGLVLVGGILLMIEFTDREMLRWMVMSLLIACLSYMIGSIVWYSLELFDIFKRIGKDDSIITCDKDTHRSEDSPRRKTAK